MKKKTKIRQISSLLSAVLVFTMVMFTSCEKNDEITTIDSVGDIELKALDQSYAAETFDEVLELSDEAMEYFDALLLKSGNGGGMGGNGGGMGGTGTGGNGTGGNGTGGNGTGVCDSTGVLGGIGTGVCDSTGIGGGMGGNGTGGNGMGGNGTGGNGTGGNGHQFHHLSDCVDITRDTIGESIITTIDFGEENCLSNDGKERRGKIIISKIGDYWAGEVDLTITFEDYFVDNNQVLGTKTVHGFINDDGNRESQMVDNGSIILADDAGTISWSAERIRIVVEGSDTIIKFDDVIEVTGSSTGTLASGETFTSEVQVPLVRIHEMNCIGVYVSGITNISISDGTEISIDYGDGTCDNLAAVTTNGVTEIIELHRHGGGHRFGGGQ